MFIMGTLFEKITAQNSSGTAIMLSGSFAAGTSVTWQPPHRNQQLVVGIEIQQAMTLV